MDEITWIDGARPRRRLKLWHLAALVAASAGLFGMLRSRDGRVGLVFVALNGILMAVFFLGLWFAVTLGPRMARAIDDWDSRRGKPMSRLARVFLFLAYLTILVGGALLAVAITLGLIAGLGTIMAD